jgi:hypothetical protein
VTINPQSGRTVRVIRNRARIRVRARARVGSRVRIRARVKVRVRVRVRYIHTLFWICSKAIFPRWIAWI